MTFFLDHDVPNDLTFALRAMGHEVLLLREALPITSSDAEVLRYAAERGHVLITCNREDFTLEAEKISHAGIILLFRRQSRAAERSALIRLIDRAGESGIRGNINYA